MHRLKLKYDPELVQSYSLASAYLMLIQLHLVHVNLSEQLKQGLKQF